MDVTKPVGLPKVCATVPADPTGPVNQAVSVSSGIQPILGIDGQFHVPAVIPAERFGPLPDIPDHSKLDRIVSNSYDLDDAASTCVNFDDRSIVGGLGDVGGELAGEEESWGQWKDDDEASTSSNEEDQSDMLQVSELGPSDDIELAESAANTLNQVEEGGDSADGLRRMDSEVIAQHLQQLGEEMVNSLEDDIDKVPVSVASDTGSESATSALCMKRPRQPSNTQPLPLTIDNVHNTCDPPDDQRLKIPRLSSNWSTCATMGDDDEKSSMCTLDETASLRVNTSRGSLVREDSEAASEGHVTAERMDDDCDPEDPGIVMNMPSQPNQPTQ